MEPVGPPKEEYLRSGRIKRDRANVGLLSEEKARRT